MLSELFRPPVHTYPFLFENRYFFYPVWPTVYTYKVKTITEKVSFQKTLSRVKIFLKRRLFVYLSTDENGGFRIRWCHTWKIHHFKFIIKNTSWHDACSIWYVVVFRSCSPFCMDPRKWLEYAKCSCAFFWKRKKIFVFKNIRTTVYGAKWWLHTVIRLSKTSMCILPVAIPF